MDGYAVCCQEKENRAQLEAELCKNKTFAEELVQQLAECQEKLRLEQKRSDKLMQRLMRFETEKQGEFQPELNQKLVPDFVELVDSMKKPD